MMTPRAKRRPIVFLPAADLADGIGVTAAAGWEAHILGRQRADARLAGLARGTRTTIQQQITTYSEALYGLRTLFALNTDASRRDFHDAVRASGVLLRFPGARTLSFDRKVPAPDRAAYEAKVRGDASLVSTGYPGFTVHPDSDAPELFVKEFVEPMTGNEVALGFDNGAVPDRRAAIEEARDSGALTATPPVTLLGNGATGVILYLAVYDQRSLPVTAPSRRRHFLGTVHASFDTDQMLRAVATADRRLQIDIFDVGPTAHWPDGDHSQSHLVFGLDPRSPPSLDQIGGPDGRRVTLDLNVGTKRWRMVARPGRGLQSRAERALPWVVGAIGVLLSALVAALLHFVARGRRDAVALVDVLTSEVEQREADFEAANRHLARANDQLSEADRERMAFLRTISHELHTPLTSIRGFSALLTERGLVSREAAWDYVGRISRNAETMGTLIRELVEYSQLEEGQGSLAAQRLSLSALVPLVVEQLEGVTAGHQIRFDLEPEITVVADLDGVTRIIANLLTNAVKFSAPGTEITITVAGESSEAILTVSDDGPGIPVTERNRVFERFYRGSGPNFPSTPGMGVGLAVVRELAERMGGGVTVSNRSEAGGACFTVRLPRLVPAVPD